jgi:hypothetical protein
MADEPKGAGAPVDDDVRHDDYEYNPQLEPKKSQAWLNLLEESEDAFEAWNEHCDKIDRLYANLERLAPSARQKEFQMFWSNCEVLKPSIYAKAPRPVVVPKFKDRRPVYQAASEILERCVNVTFDLAHIDELMRMLRDDIALAGRGVAWCRYESGKGEKSYYATERVCIDFKHRRDFLHSVSRHWAEVTWVAAASYLTRAEARERFKPYSDDEYQDAEYVVDRDAKEIGGADNRERAKFWEIWDKSNRRVVWVAKGCEKILDEDDAHLDLENFFPCPKPCYGTVQRGSLVPVPDIMQYKDQLEEINNLTARIHALSDALEAKGFYPAGSTELSDAVNAAVRTHAPGRVLVPISNWAAFGQTKEVIVWMPIDMIAQTITQCVAVRKQVIDDIYQIMGLSDIMRGATDARETLGAQQLKSQFGSTRIRDKQQEIVRIARDLVQIAAEIICEKFDEETIVWMSQTQLPTDEMQRAQVKQLTQQMAQQQQMVQQKMQSPEAQQAMQQNPDMVQQGMQQFQALQQEGAAAIEKIKSRPNFQQVMEFLHDERARQFVLDIETDSTIMVDENAEKQRRGEFMSMLSQLLPQLIQMIGVAPESAELAGEFLKFSSAPYSAGRGLDGAIDALVETMKEKGGQPKGDDPVTAQNKITMQIEQMKLEAKKETDKQEMALKAAELKQRDDHAKMKIASDERMKQIELQGKQEEDRAKAEHVNLKAIADREKHQADMIKRDGDMQALRQKAQYAAQTNQMKMGDIAARANERQQAAQFKQQQAAQKEFMQP